MGKVDMSVVILAKNEEQNIGNCLTSVDWAYEKIVVDDESSDRTSEIARVSGARVVRRKMDVEGAHRNKAYALATTDWVLSLDADERVSPELARELSRIVDENNRDYSAYSIPIKTFIGKKWVNTAGYYPARKLRFFRKGKFRYEEANVHPRAFLEGREKALNGDIIHYGYRDMTHLIEKLNNQTTLEAEKWMRDGRRVSCLKISFKSVTRFFKFYFQRGSCRHGFLGLFMSSLHCLYQVLTYAKYKAFLEGANRG